MPVIEKGLGPSDDGKFAANRENLPLETKAEVPARPHTAERVEPVKVVAVEERTVARTAGQPNGAQDASPSRAPGYRAHLARALADAVVGAIDAEDAEGAKVAVGMLEQFVVSLFLAHEIVDGTR